MRAARLGLVTLAAAAGGSASGAAFLVVPTLLSGTIDEGGFPAGAIFLVSLPFTLVGASLWALLYSRFAVPSEIRRLDHG